MKNILKYEKKQFWRVFIAGFIMGLILVLITLGPTNFKDFNFSTIIYFLIIWLIYGLAASFLIWIIYLFVKGSWN